MGTDHVVRMTKCIVASQSKIGDTVKLLSSGHPEQGSTTEKGPNYNYASLLFLTKYNTSGMVTHQ